MRKGKSVTEIEGDFDTFVRLQICQLVNEMADRASVSGSTAFDTPEQFIACAEQLEHYITHGGTVAFECNEGSRKFVRGE